MSIKTRSNWLVVKIFAVLSVMKNGVVFKYFVERRQDATQKTFFVHQSTVNLMFDKRHQDGHSGEPGSKLNDELYHSKTFSS